MHGKIGKLTFKRGLGNPAGVFTAKSRVSGLLLPSTLYGTPPGTTGYPAAGLSGGTIRATKIGKLKVWPANVLVQTAQNPDFVQLGIQGYPTYAVSPGYSLTNAVDHHVGIDRQHRRGGHRSSTARSRPGSTTRPISPDSKGRAAPAGSACCKLQRRPGQQRQLGELPSRQQPLQHATGTAGPGSITAQVSEW